MNHIGLKGVHIGKAIRQRVEELRLNKSEFARLIGTPQQHINRIFDKETIDTGKLLKISRALNFNFFSLYCGFHTNISANLSAVTLHGNAHNNLGDSSLIGQLETSNVKLENAKVTEADLRDQIAGLKDCVELLKSQLRDKDEIIKLTKTK